MSFIFFLKKILSIKLQFLPPKKSKILIYDYASVTSNFSKIVFKNNKHEVLHTRYEILNIYILIKAVFSLKLHNITNRYKYFYIKQVEPKIVYTSIDNNPAFFLLKDIYPNTTYIVDQNGTRNNLFYDICLKERKKRKVNYKSDYFFISGDYYKNALKKIINTKFIIHGNTKNNEFRIFKKIKKKRAIVYISSKFQIFEKLETKNFKNLLTYCKKNNYKLYLLDRPGQSNEKFFRNIFPEEKWSYIANLNLYKKFQFIYSCSLVAFAHSTLGYECLSRGLKCISFDFGRHIFSLNAKHNKKGPFWCSPENYLQVEKKLNQVVGYNKEQWKKIYFTYSKKIMSFDEGNTKINKVVNLALKKNN